MSEDMQKLQEALVANRKAFEEGNKEMEAKTEKVLADADAKNQELVIRMNEEIKAREALSSEIKEMEAKLCRPGFSAKEDEGKAEIKAFDKFLKKGHASLEGVELKYLRTDDNTDGGYLVPEQHDSEIIKKIIEISPIMAIARVRNMGSKTLTMPTRTGLVTVGWVGEGEEDTLSNSKYGKEQLTAHGIQVTVPITRQILQDSVPDIASEINSDVAEAFEQKMGTAFTNGDGVEKPEGFMASGIITQEVNSGNASTIDSLDAFFDLEAKVKTGYRRNAVYGFNKNTLAIIRKLKDDAGNYIWRAGNIGAGIPNAINEVSYVEIPDMPDAAAGTYPIIYGDFSKGYMIGNRLGMTIIRDDYSQKRKSIVEFTYSRRVDGGVVLPEAFAKMKVSA